jgi:hypothetical protein
VIEGASDATTHIQGSDPQVLQVEKASVEDEAGEADNVVRIACGESFMRGNEGRRDGERGTPVLDPAFGISPVAFGGEGDLGEDIGFRGKRAGDVHGERNATQVLADRARACAGRPSVRCIHGN